MLHSRYAWLNQHPLTRDALLVLLLSLLALSLYKIGKACIGYNRQQIAEIRRLLGETKKR